MDHGGCGPRGADRTRGGRPAGYDRRPEGKQNIRVPQRHRRFFQRSRERCGRATRASGDESPPSAPISSFNQR